MKTDLTKTQDQKSPIASTPLVQDARELLSSKKKQETRMNFPKIVFGDDTTSEKTTLINKKKAISVKTTRDAKTETPTSTMASQTESDRSENEDTGEICVSRVDPNICMQEEKAHNVQPPTMTTTTQIKASHFMIMEGLVATIEKATTATNTTEMEEDNGI